MGPFWGIIFHENTFRKFYFRSKGAELFRPPPILKLNCAFGYGWNIALCKLTDSYPESWDAKNSVVNSRLKREQIKDLTKLQYVGHENILWLRFHKNWIIGNTRILYCEYLLSSKENQKFQT